MTSAEFRLFSRVVSASRSYLEFGMGGSTISAIQLGTPHITAVESSKEWIDYVQSDQSFQPKSSQNILLHHADIGPVKEAGWPVGDNTKWAEYYKGVWRKVDPFDVDTVFVDGRFRVSCALEAILRCKASIVILFHDWDRDFYHVVLRHADLVERTEKMAMLAPKHLQDRAAIESLLMSKRFDPS